MKPDESTNNPAADIVRQKVQQAYAVEPPVNSNTHTISHRAYFDRLVASGASAEDVQKAWHAYYQGLSAEEKTRVWNEYNQTQTSAQTPSTQPAVVQQSFGGVSEGLVNHQRPKRIRRITENPRAETVADLKAMLTERVASRAGTIKKSKHTKPLLTAFAVGAIFLGLNYNQLAVASVKNYIAPGSTTSTPLILGSTGEQAVSADPKIIVPKINLDIPVVYDEPSIEEPKVQAALERGAVHYADTPRPGEPGNIVIVGHSSNNVLNNGKFKFAFVLLNRIELNDTFILNFESKRYIYKVYSRKIVKPTDVSVLGAAAKSHTVTLITCDPPGSAVNRLIIQAEQISPVPSDNDPVRSTASQPTVPTQVPGNAPSFFQRIRSWIF